MSTKSFANATSLEPFLNRKVLFVQGIDQNVPKAEVIQVLRQVLKDPQQGRIDILTAGEVKLRGTAFLNFLKEEDCRAALEKWRFSLELRGHPLRMQYSSDKEFKDLIQRPQSVARFKVLIRNLPEELTQEAIFQMFSQYGEIIQVHRDCDHHHQYYAIIQYVDVAAAQSAIRDANRAKVLSHVLVVEQYKPPKMEAAGAGGSSPTGGVPSGSRNSGATLPGTTYAALQQQQERERAEQERQAAAAAERRMSESSAAAAGMSKGADVASQQPAEAASSGLAVASFYGTAAVAAGGPLTSPTAPGSLAHLLSTALHHVHALEEHLCCPITQEPLVDPVVAADGNTYERLAIEAWLEQHDTSPMTNGVLPHKALVPNNLLKKIAEELKGISHPAAAPLTPTSAAHRQQHTVARGAAAQVGGGGDAAALVGPLPAQMDAVGGAQADFVPVPVPMQAPQPLVSYHYQQQQQLHGGYTHAQQPPPPPQQQHPQQQRQPQQQFAEYGQIMRSQLMPAPVTFMHSLQPQPINVQGATYFSYRPMGM